MGIFDRKPNVEKLRRKKDVKGLIKALGYEKDAEVRILSAKALAELGDMSVIETLAKVLQNDPNSTVQYTAIAAVIELGQNMGLDEEILAELIRVDEKTLAKLISKGFILAHLGDVLLISNRQALAEIAGDKRRSQRVRKRAKGLLHASEASFLIKQGKYKQAVGMGAHAVKAFSQAIRACPDWSQKLKLAKYMEQIEDPNAVGPLLGIFDTAFNEELEAVVHLFDKLGDARAIEPLQERFHRGWIAIDVEFAAEVDRVIHRLEEKSKR